MIYDRKRESRLSNSLFFLHWSKKVNRLCNLPWKRIWFSGMCIHKFDVWKPCCYVFFGGKYITEASELRAYIHRLNPQNKCLIYCGDLISKKHWDIDKVKACCDKIVTYDPDEAKHYGIECYNAPIYGKDATTTMPDEFQYDVFFLGFAKDRLHMIREVYRRLKEGGLRCHFIVCGVPNAEQITDGIHYTAPIPYRENIEYVKKSKCILEIMQGGSNTSTLRCNEALIYKRKLLTNYIGIRQQSYFNPAFISTFSHANDIDFDFLKTPIDYSVFPPPDAFSPLKLIDFFDKILA